MKITKKLTEHGYFHGYLCNKKKILYSWEHLDDPRHKYYFNNPEYLYNTRNITTDDFIPILKKDSKMLLENY